MLLRSKALGLPPLLGKTLPKVASPWWNCSRTNAKTTTSECFIIAQQTGAAVKLATLFHMAGLLFTYWRKNFISLRAPGIGMPPLLHYFSPRNIKRMAPADYRAIRRSFDICNKSTIIIDALTAALHWSIMATSIGEGLEFILAIVVDLKFAPY